MDFIKFGDGAKITDSSIIGNVLIVDDLSKVETFIRIGDNSEIIRLDVNGNEVHTPESFALITKSRRDALFAELAECQEAMISVQNDLAKQKIKQALTLAAAQDLTIKGEFDFRRIISGVATSSKEIGVAVVAGIISKYLGF